MQFFADRILGATADGFMVELHDTGIALRVFDGWGEMCIIEAKKDDVDREVVKESEQLLGR